MQPHEVLGRIGVFVLVLVVVVGSAVAGPLMQGEPSPPPSAAPPAVEVPTFQPDRIVADQPTEVGTVTMSADGSGTVVLVDQAHGNDVSDEQLGLLVRSLTASGATVTTVGIDRARGPAFNETLRKADAFVSISPQQSFTEEQIAGLRAFADGGGRVLLFGEPTHLSMGGNGLVPQVPTNPGPMASLTSAFGLAYGNGYLYNMYENANNYRSVYAVPSDGSDFASGVDRVAVREGTPVYGGQPVLTSLDRTALSTTREEAAYPIAARSGNLIAVGDTTLVAETGARKADNEVLVGRLFDFLVSGEKRPGVPGQPGADEPGSPDDGERPPTPTG